VQSDYVFHPPSGSSYPGKEDANPYIFYPPNELRRLVDAEKNEEELTKIKSALKQWERIYVYPGYPWRIAGVLRKIASHLMKLSEISGPAQNIPYYQDSEVPEGYEGILHGPGLSTDGISSPYDNYNMERFDYSRQGERPIRDIDTGRGNFLSPSDPPLGDVVKTKGEGPDPDIICPSPPTGGNSGAI